MQEKLSEKFGFVRSFLWPVHRSEFKKIIPMLIMLFLICFNYGILRSMKDSILITTSGAKVLPFIKIWGILPMAIFITYLLSKLNNRFNLERVFYIMTTSFLVFFLLFAFVIYPNRDILHPYESANFLEHLLPKGLSGLIALYRHWTLSLFYVLSELWCSFILSTLFWGFANAVIPVKEAKRYYAVLAIGSNFAALVAGQAANFFSGFTKGSWDATINLLILVVCLSGIVIIFVFRWLNRNIFTPELHPELHSKLAIKKRKKKPSLKESFAFLSKSKYLLYIAILLISYNLATNLFEIVWKDHLHRLLPNPQDFNRYMNNVTSMVGLISLLLTLCIPHMIERFGWTKVALITPVIVAITGIGFFSFLFLNKAFPDQFLSFSALSPLAIAVFFGATQTCLSKAAKYSVFDTTKEIAFIPLDHEIRLKSKAPIEVLGARFGKFGGSFVYQGLLLGVGSLSACIPMISVLLALVISFWISSTRNLGRLFNEKVKEQTESTEAPTLSEASAS